MGRNAQRRRDEKNASRLATSPAAERRRNSRTLERLRQKARSIETLQQFEEIVAQSHPDNRSAVRRLLEPMLRHDLPCCGVNMLSVHLGEHPAKHGRMCPKGRLVELA